MQRLLQRFCGAQTGSFATLFGLVSPLLIGAAALAVDVASLHLERRQLQQAADLAAIYAAGDPRNAAGRVSTALADAGYALSDGSISVLTGRYAADPALPPHQRLDPSGKPVNAVRVALAEQGHLHFASIFGFRPPLIDVMATASATPLVAYSIGSRLASLDDGVLNAVLGDLLGTKLSLSVLDYQSIANLDVDLLTFLDALAGKIGLTAGSYSDVLAANVTLSDIALALSSAGGDNTVLLDISGSIDRAIKVDMSRLIVADGIGHLALGTAAAVEAQVKALHLLSAAALLADGERHIKLTLDADVPGLVEIGVTLVIGEAPQGGWFAIAGEGSYVRTAQTHLKLDIKLVASAEGAGVLDVSLPVYAALAPAEARLSAFQCSPGNLATATATFEVTPGILRLSVGETSRSSFLDTSHAYEIRKTSIVSLLGGLAEITARADVRMRETGPIAVGFTYPEVVAGSAKTISTSTPLTSLTTSLLEHLELELDAMRLSLFAGAPGATEAVSDLLTPLAPVLDQTLEALFKAVGLGVGETVLRVHGFDCRNATLVQ